MNNVRQEARAKRRLAAAKSELEPIVDACAAHYGLFPVALLSRRRSAGLVRPRHIAMYLAREMTMCSFPEIAAALGRSDHTTAMHGAEKIAREIKTNPRIARDVAAIERALWE